MNLVASDSLKFNAIATSNEVFLSENSLYACVGETNVAIVLDFGSLNNIVLFFIFNFSVFSSTALFKITPILRGDILCLSTYFGYSCPDCKDLKQVFLFPV